jgi:hypothetical protein
METQKEQFMRIANARLMNIYKFKPQRTAWVAKMYVKWQEKNK